MKEHPGQGVIHSDPRRDREGREEAGLLELSPDNE